MVAPQGLTTTGVTTWSVRLLSALAQRAHPAGILIHGRKAGYADLAPTMPPTVRRFERQDLAPLEDAEGDIGAFIDAYAQVALALRDETGRPVALVPMRLGDCFGACAALTRDFASDIRIIGWQQVDSAYEDAILARYEVAMAALVGASAYLGDRLGARFPDRLTDIRSIPNAVPLPANPPPPRPDLQGRPLRLIYHGRIEHEQKRVRALVSLSDALGSHGVAHSLTLLGDGPAAREIDEAIAGRPFMRRLPAVAPDSVRDRLFEADIAVLASRTEGLSFSVLEAMAAGCVPVITATPSGSGEAIEDGVSGALVPFGESDSDEDVGRAMGETIARLLESADLGRMSVAAHHRVRQRFSLESQVEATLALLRDVASAEPRRWPERMDPAFSAPRGAGRVSGAVPTGAGDRLAALLDRLAGRRVVIHGTGRHTLELARVVENRLDRIVGFADDDPGRQGEMLMGRPIVAPEKAGATGATNVVISSWMHEAAIWARRGVYERQGLTVHRLYADKDAERTSRRHDAA